MLSVLITLSAGILAAAQGGIALIMTIGSRGEIAADFGAYIMLVGGLGLLARVLVQAKNLRSRIN
jgi:hypothetical protein